ncbi:MULTISPECIES: tRNA 2-thiouridine(34) synthase MnmA [unclassified Actinomyces]|uniref:tRNA 2-thiouridine(34) synthase MnmA n=1 Tax=unclassified Actinomyces TaxID=2609248 RepID=UPI00201718B9|nr:MULTISPECIES: tRNA 2-thiouridine(34) synthase MnmA [unclassified Actinomyces]MCL3778071.1 tRNA 2-thiouridine(34) synthase MnmA [Actinomyces sp. AC-20-1]MCL3790494.1 tRNA 2-thiouridine(34) synthase MnmA [Actinomyces sp. 187325]MCL3792773.1 tRNA 2-thiouridine(34) synthase MnmA [Actinomyces sp. 186855]MCL3795242.1 tRNA 2-thiouridine(34) synthase MnmA [Actinomyces sp. 217892]
MRVLAALSGGVDSAVAAARALDAGHEVVGVHMALTRQRAQTRPGSRGCCSIEDAADARWAAQVLGIPFYVWDLSQEFEERVVADFLSEYRAGRTPNPCVRCNERVKFDALLERGLAMGFDAVVTGHYARLSGGAADGRPGDTEGLVLARAADAAKDQSYVLAVSGREGLSRALFPLGDAPSKARVRAEAAERGLPVADKPDSYDICFVADGDTRGFLQRSLGTRQGALVSPDGEVLGSHGGYFGFTVGQRRGLGLTRPAPDGRPRYVVETRPETNEVVVGPEELLTRRSVEADGLVLLASPEPVSAEGAQPTGRMPDGEAPALGWRGVSVQVRAHGRPVPADVVVDPVAGALRAELREGLRGLAAGQSVVVYGGAGGERVLAQATVS